MVHLVPGARGQKSCASGRNAEASATHLAVTTSKLYQAYFCDFFGFTPQFVVIKTLNFFALFAASCSQRMIGQKRQSDGSVISTSCVELFSQYPDMYNYMLEKLKKSEPGKPDPSIFPILSLISTLSPCTLSSKANS